MCPAILILLAFYCPSRAQFSGTDTLFRAQELVYFSPLEQKAFYDFLNGKPDYLAMIAAVNPGTDKRELGLYRERIDEIIRDIREKKFEELGKEGKIDRIRKYVSRGLLTSYNQEADFDDLFRNGRFNYFTAASIYAFILDRFGIPYEIRELPTHIYLVAFPGEQPIELQTTAKGFQFFMFNHETRMNFVEFIHNQGVIDDYTYRNTATKELFQQYYFARQGLSIREMIGMLYLNSAVEMMVLGRANDYYAQVEKAFILYPSYRSQYLLLIQLFGYLENMDYRNPLHLGYLIKASRLIHYGIDRDIIDHYLLDIVNKILVRDEDRNGFMYIYEYLGKYIEDEPLKRNFEFYYLYESGRTEFQDLQYARALDYFEQAFRLRPQDEYTRDFFVRSIGGYSLLVSPAHMLEKLHLYDSAYTEITDEGIYLMVKLQTYLQLFGESFQMQDRSTGEKYMGKFEQLMDEYPEIGIDQLLVGRSYSSAAIYYYRQGMINHSRQAVEKGLSYAPDNIELKMKLSAFD